MNEIELRRSQLSRSQLSRSQISRTKHSVDARVLVAVPLGVAAAVVLSLLVHSAAPFSTQRSNSANLRTPDKSALNKNVQQPKVLLTPQKEYVLGLGGWQYERFGEEVTILRTRLKPRSDSGETGLFVLSCEGRSLILKIKLPDAREILSLQPSTTRFQVFGAPYVVTARIQVEGQVLSFDELSGDFPGLLQRADTALDIALEGGTGAFSMAMTLQDQKGANSALGYFRQTCPASERARRCAPPRSTSVWS